MPRTAGQILSNIRQQLEINVKCAERDYPEGSIVDGRRSKCLPHSQDVLAQHIRVQLDELEQVIAIKDRALESEVDEYVACASVGAVLIEGITLADWTSDENSTVMQDCSLAPCATVDLMAPATTGQYVEFEQRMLRQIAQTVSPVRKFALRDRVRKLKGSSWQGSVVGFYTTQLTPVGYAVESEREPGSVQIYPETALEFVPDDSIPRHTQFPDRQVSSLEVRR